jgi:hypothetical protein
MIDKFRKVINSNIARRISVGSVGAALVALSFNAYYQDQLSDKERQAIEAQLGGIASAEPNLDDIIPRKLTKKEIAQNKPEITNLNYELSPIVAINITNGLIKEDKVLKYDWEAHYDDETGDVEYNPESFTDMYVSIEPNDRNRDGKIDEQRGRLGLANGKLQGVVFGLGHTHSDPNIDAVMDKINEVKIGDIVTATTKSGITYVFTVNEIKLADKKDPNDKAKRCGSAGRIFTCFVNEGSATDTAVYLCLGFKGIEQGDRTILAMP